MRVPEVITSDWLDAHRGKKVTSWLWPFGERDSAENRELADSLRYALRKASPYDPTDIEQLLTLALGG